MKALTISQPFASLIANGQKWVENRTWPTSYRGPLAIHAGKGSQYLDCQQLAQYPTGCMVAVAELFACMPLESMRCMNPFQRIGLSELQLKDVLEHEHTEGPWCWVLRNVRRLHVPCPCRGAQGLWSWVPSETLKFAR